MTKPQTEQEKKEQQDREQRAAKAAETRKRKAGTVKATVNQANGAPLHLCEDDKWRTDQELAELAEDDN